MIENVEWRLGVMLGVCYTRVYSIMVHAVQSSLTVQTRCLGLAPTTAARGVPGRNS
jgi:hypothetical protein